MGDTFRSYFQVVLKIAVLPLPLPSTTCVRAPQDKDIGNWYRYPAVPLVSGLDFEMRKLLGEGEEGKVTIRGLLLGDVCWNA